MLSAALDLLIIFICIGFITACFIAFTMYVTGIKFDDWDNLSDGMSALFLILYTLICISCTWVVLSW